MLKKCRQEFYQLKNATYAKTAMSFFKTGPGEYGEGDLFLGIGMPITREHAKKYLDLDIKSVESLMSSKWHEERMLGVIILMLQFEKAMKSNFSLAEKLFKTYVKNKKYINNWDLVDVSCPRVVGAYLFERERDILYQWAKSKDLWTKRLSIVSTMYFIRRADFQDALKISELHMNDNHDLMHKAVGWMLREIGKKDKAVLDKFLIRFQKQLPRTALRYAIERHPADQRKKLLSGTFL